MLVVGGGLPLRLSFVPPRGPLHTKGNLQLPWLPPTPTPANWHKTVWLWGRIQSNGKDPLKRSTEKYSSLSFYFIGNYNNVLQWAFLLFDLNTKLH